MKNEASVLPRMLNSVNYIVDECVCVDTGSTDNSKEIVKDFFDSQNKKCTIYDYPFTNFADSRNLALSKIDKSKNTFGFWIDCDEELILEEGFYIDNLKKQLSETDLGTSLIGYDNLKYSRRNFFRTDKNFYWKGAVHEILLCDENIRQKEIKWISVKVHTDGHSHRYNTVNAQLKFVNHAEILIKEVEKSNDSRDVFYLAQSYRDAGELHSALYWYKKRAERTDGFSEERYYSQFCCGVLSEDLGMPFMDCLAEYMKCFDLDDMRAEHLLHIILLFQKRGNYETSYVFSKYGVEKYHGKNPYPQRHLFLHLPTYEYKLLNCHKLNCEKTGRKL